MSRVRRSEAARVAAFVFLTALVPWTARAAEALPPDGPVRLQSACGAQVLEVSGASTRPEAALQLWDWQGEAHQAWRLEHLADGRVRLTARHSTLALTPPAAPATAAVQRAWAPAAALRLVPRPDGTVQLLAADGRALAAAGNGAGATVGFTAAGSGCVQAWSLVQLQEAGVPAQLRPYAGDAQTAPAGSRLPVAPAVRLLDEAGSGVPGASVKFRVVDGGGVITGAQAVTDSAGVARVGSWTLGPTTGEQHLSAVTPGLPEAVLGATALAAGRHLELDASADHQMGTVGQPLPRLPSVQVLDAAGRPVAGVTVRFTASNDGRVAQASDVSDAQGRASAGAWTLGPAKGVQYLRASAEGYGAVRFGATALPVGAPIPVHEVFMRGVYELWEMAFAPGGAMLYTERARGLSVRLADGSTRRLFAPADLVAVSESGMLGLALDPAFATNRRVYVFMASNRDGARDNRVVRLRVRPDWSGVEERTDIVTGIDFQTARGLLGLHSGGALGFDAQGWLMVSTGDIRDGEVPQSARSLGGKILRVDSDGRPAPGNAAPAGTDPRVWVRGVRSGQGFALQPGTARPYLVEHGPGDNDEVTPLRAGNGGWDPRPRPLDAPDARCPNGTLLTYCGYDGANMTDTVLYPDALRPAWRTGKPSRGTAHGAFLSAAGWKGWKGALVVSQLSGRRLLVLQFAPDGNSVRYATPLLEDRGVRLRAVVQGPDGALYVSTSSDNNRSDVQTQVWRLKPPAQ